MDCAMCGSKGLFQVEDLPVGPRWFCTEKHFAEYAGLPVKESGYYGFEAEGELERKYFTRFGDQRGGKEWGEYTFTWFNNMGDWKPIDEDTTGWDEDDFADFREAKEYDLVNQMLENPKSSLYRAIENNMTYVDEEDFSTSYEVMDEDGDVGRLNLLISWEEPANVEQIIQYYDKEPLYRLEFLAESFSAEAPRSKETAYDEPANCQNCEWYGLSSELVWDFEGHQISQAQCPNCSFISYVWSSVEEPAWLQAESKKLPPIEKAEITGVVSGATMEGLETLLAAEGILCKGCPEAGRHVVIRKDHTDEDGNLICPFCHSNKNFKNIPETTYLLHGGRKDDLMAAEWADEHPCEHCGSTDIDYGNNWKCHDCGRYAAESNAEEPSVYYWVKTEMEKRHPITEPDLEQLLEMLSLNVPVLILENGMEQAEDLRDEPTYLILHLARQKAKFIEEYQAEEYGVADKDWAGQSCEDCYEEIKVGDLVHDDGYMLICKKCYSNYKIPCKIEACDERFKNDEEEGEHRQESCSRCGGEGWIMTSYTSATYHDPADADGEDCDECWGEGRVCFNAESNQSLYQQAIDTIEARVADYSTHEDVNPYWGGGMANPNKYLYFKLRYSWDKHPEDRGEIIEQYMMAIEDGRIDPSNPLPHGAPNQHLPSKLAAESFSAEQGNEIVGFCENKEGFCFTNERTYVCDKCNHCYVGCEDRDGDTPDEGCKCLYAESFSGDWIEEFNQSLSALEESKKRTKMSAIRTGLAITTFGIVMWNLWTNKKQEKDISDIMAEV